MKKEKMKIETGERGGGSSVLSQYDLSETAVALVQEGGGGLCLKHF